MIAEKVKNTYTYKGYVIDSIHYLVSDYEDNDEILFEGTPIKVLGGCEDKIKCEDFRGKTHNIFCDFIYYEEIRKYPRKLDIIMRRIINFLARELPQTFLSYFMLGSYAIMFLCLLSGTITQINSDIFPKETTYMVVFFTALAVAIGIIKLIVSFIGKNLLYTKENLKELKILFNKMGES